MRTNARETKQQARLTSVCPRCPVWARAPQEYSKARPALAQRCVLLSFPGPLPCDTETAVPLLFWDSVVGYELHQDSQINAI